MYAGIVTYTREFGSTGNSEVVQLGELRMSIEKLIGSAVFQSIVKV